MTYHVVIAISICPDLIRNNIPFEFLNWPRKKKKEKKKKSQKGEDSKGTIMVPILAIIFFPVEPEPSSEVILMWERGSTPLKILM